jgi:deazaflavin-dependent oxidoreductase (nitroreductase family)
MSDMNDWNASVIEEFRANAGQVGGQLAGMPVLLLHTIGVKSGKPRINPVAYLPDGDRVVIFASYAGSPTNPDWYRNLVANPDVTVELGDEMFPATASVVTGSKRDELYAEQAAKLPQFAEYEQKTTRKIPVVALTRR